MNCGLNKKYLYSNYVLCYQTREKLKLFDNVPKYRVNIPAIAIGVCGLTRVFHCVDKIFPPKISRPTSVAMLLKNNM